MARASARPRAGARSSWASSRSAIVRNRRRPTKGMIANSPSRFLRGVRGQRLVRYVLERVGETAANPGGVGRRRFGRRRELDLGRSAAQPDWRAGRTRCLSRAGVHQRYVEEVVRRRLSRSDHLDRHAPHHAARTRRGRLRRTLARHPRQFPRQCLATDSSGRVAERPRPPRVPPELC